LLAGSIFTRTNGAIVVLYHLLAGLSFSSFSLFGAAFFKKAQLSGISVTIVAILLAILAQVVADGSTAIVAILGLIFPPMNYVFFIILMARFERPGLATNLLKSPPENKSTLPGIALILFLLVQLLLYPLLAALVERSWHTAASQSRKLAPQPDGAAPVIIQNFSKQYRPSWFLRNVWRLFAKPADTVMAVDNLSLTVPRGQIMVLLGANGSGKSTTLGAIAGLHDFTAGNVLVDGTGGLGLCPQKVSSPLPRAFIGCV
jgi:ABC-type multidrug transport system fused ATPase/permease subunit